MEHELFQSKLKPFVNRALISNIIESSSSGKHPHHSVVMGLILERSIQDRHERISKKEKNPSQPNSITQPENGVGTSTAPIPQGLSLAPNSAPHPLSSSSTLASASAITGASPGSSEPGK